MGIDNLSTSCQEAQKQSKVQTQIGKMPITFPDIEENTSSEFTLIEIIEMQKSLKGLKEGSLNPEFCQKLATQFSCSPNRHGKPSVKWEEVHAWFQERHEQGEQGEQGEQVEQGEAKSTNSLELFRDLRVYSPIRSSNVNHKTLHKNKVESAAVLRELLFEAKSARDLAWYDVGYFITYRVSSLGELLVRVRFAGFDNSNDEWASVEREVRERSIPLQDSECDMVEVGDLVLCYRKDEDEDMYFDAHITKIERNFHDLEPCICSFIVRYDHDAVEENVDLHKLCRRPS